MSKTIEGATDCEIRSVIRFLNARNVLPSEIHHQICQVYGDNAMSDGMVRKWVRMFIEGRENVQFQCAHHELHLKSKEDWTKGWSEKPVSVWAMRRKENCSTELGTILFITKLTA